MQASDAHEYNFTCNSTTVLGGTAPEGQYVESDLHLACEPGTGVITQILFADFGTPTLSRDCTNYNCTLVVPFSLPKY